MALECHLRFGSPLHADMYCFKLILWEQNIQPWQSNFMQVPLFIDVFVTDRKIAMMVLTLSNQTHTQVIRKSHVQDFFPQCLMWFLIMTSVHSPNLDQNWYSLSCMTEWLNLATLIQKVKNSSKPYIHLFLHRTETSSQALQYKCIRIKIQHGIPCIQ